MAGWSVRHIPSSTNTGTGNFRFKKKLESQAQRRVYTSDSFLQRFIQNMQRLSEEVSSFELPSDRDIVFP